MLSRAHRLRGDPVFKRLARIGQPFFGTSLTFRIAPQGTDRSLPTRFAFVVSTKVSKKAVERNLLRRRLREIIRAELPQLKTGLEVLIIARPQARQLDFQALKQEVEALLTKSRLWL